MAKTKSNAFKNIAVLLGVALIAVTLLAVINQVTRDRIAQAEIDARNEVYRAVFADASDFGDIDNLEAVLEEFNSGRACSISDAHIAVDESGNGLGYVIASSSPNGYGGDIQIAVGITDEGVITAFSVVQHSETAGLGSRAKEDPEFYEQFAGKKAEAIVYTKDGASANNEIDAISGATITTNAVTEAVNAAIDFYHSMKGE